MQIKSIRLENFRNIKSQSAEFCDGINILYGNNAQGKTNLVEAVYYLACGKSFRGARDKELIMFSEKEGSISSCISSQKGENDLQVKISTQNPKEIYINRVKISKMREFMGTFRAVLFTPEHLSLIKGSPFERRSFTDSAICQLKPKFISLLFEYSKILEQRNALLRAYRQNDSQNGDQMIEYWNYMLSKDAALIINQRREYIKRLDSKAKEFYNSFCNGKETLKISYSGIPDEIEGPGKIEKYITQKLEENLQSDIKNGSTSTGPHRDDLTVEIGGKLSKLYSSQGQQRSCILSMKLAEGEISHEESGEYPVFLFDDILSELDLERQDYILHQIHSKQVFITGCIDYLFDSVKGAKKIYVEKGVYEDRDISPRGQ
ncbi:MAG: DNA replication/repair protein RecF [Clostridia bacterium]|nr:DNA replication/repair protein RecF [Clostridia bacterium]